MTKNLKRIGFIFLLGYFIVSCHKYPQDKFISFKSPYKRIMCHNWILTKYTVDGIDSTANYHLNPVVSGGRKIPKLAFMKESHLFSAAGTCDLGVWRLIDNDKRLELENIPLTPACIGLYLFPSSSKSIWTILRLSNEQLKISSKINIKYYELTFTAHEKKCVNH